MEVETSSESSNKKLNNMVAITVVILSVFLAFQNVKSGNVAQAIEQTKADTLDKWNQYQAARLKHDLAEVALSMNKVMTGAAGVDAATLAAERDKIEKAVVAYVDREKRYSAEARELEQSLKSLNKRDDQFDVAEAVVSLALAISAIAILAESWMLLGLAWAFGVFGVTMGGSAMAGYDLYPAWLVDLIT
ncbi:MAG: DUF4337 family protein [Rhizobiales bacterium]|nr:DUF4337 family protein [Hyphomicrobiales bacterium]